MPSIFVEILGSAAEFKKSLDEAVASTTKANSGFSRMSKAAGIAGLAITGGLAVGLEKSVDAAEHAQQATARMDAAFKAVGESSRAYSGQIEEAEKSSRKLGFANSDVRDSLGSLVIATHNGRQAIEDLGVAQDVARFKHLSLEAATKTLTMAMSGSTRAAKQLGITVVPVTSHMDALAAKSKFASAAAYTQAKAAAQLADKMATAKEVIAATTEKVHGQAEAFASTSAGGMAQFHAQIDNLEEQIGAGLIPAMTALTQVLASVAGFFGQHVEITKILVVALGALGGVLLTVSIATKLVSATTAVWTAAQWVLNAALDANPIGIVVVALAALGAALVVAWTKSETFRNVVIGAWEAIRNAATTVFGAIQQTIRTVLAAIQAVWTTVWGAISGVVTREWNIIKAEVLGAVNVIKSVITLALDVIHGKWSSVLGDLGGIASAAFNAVLGVVRAVLGNTVVSVITGAVDKILSVMRTGWGLVAGIIKGATGAISSAVGGIISVFQGVINVLNDIVGAAGSAIGAIDRVVHAAGAVKGAVGGVLSHIPGFASGVTNFSGGLALVGENGPELVRLPRGADVIPRVNGGGLSPAAAGAGGSNTYYTVNVSGVVGDKTAVMQEIRSGLLKIARAEPNIFGGRA